MTRAKEFLLLWTAQQMREATPFGVGPELIIRDNDGKFGAMTTARLRDPADGRGSQDSRYKCCNALKRLVSRPRHGATSGLRSHRLPGEGARRATDGD
jgi:hypothetical protein